MAPWSIYRNRYLPRGFIYPEPERYTSSIARANRLRTLLKQDQRFADLKNFQGRLAALSQASNKKIVAPINRKFVKGQTMIGPQAALIAAALSKFKESDFSDPRKRAAYRELRRQQEALRAQSSRGGRKNASVAGADKRVFHPAGKGFAVNRSGTFAALHGVNKALHQVFRIPYAVVPCIQRAIRREVMFATKKAGSGYRSPKRRTWVSGVPC